MLCFLDLTCTLAQAAGSPAAVDRLTLWDFLVRGGVLMIPIAACSLVALTLFVERLSRLQRSRIAPPGLSDNLKAALGPQRDQTEAGLKLLSRYDTPLADVLAVALRHRAQPRDSIERALEQAGDRAALALRKYLRVLGLIVSIAPMLGLLGTVFGMISAFQTVATSAEALGQAELLAKGIYEALITTAAGLLVAIPTLMMHHYLSGRVERRLAEMEVIVTDLVDDLTMGGAAPAAPLTRPAAQVAPAGAADAALRPRLEPAAGSAAATA